MNETFYTAILLKATDYRESDRRVRLLSLEGGLLTAVMRGVKKNGAKLKFGAQPFAFCQYGMVNRGGNNTVTACAPLGDFFVLTQDTDKYIAASLLLEAADAASTGQPNPKQFLLLLSCLKALAYTDADPCVVAAHYLLRVTDLLGYASDYGNMSSDPPKNLANLFAALQQTPTDRLDTLIVEPLLALRAAKMQAGRFTRHTDVLLKAAKMLSCVSKSV